MGMGKKAGDFVTHEAKAYAGHGRGVVNLNHIQAPIPPRARARIS